jgi:hemolysin III
MKKNIKSIELVDRGLGAEIFSAIVNGIGGMLALTALILVIVFSSKYGGAKLILTSIFYGVVVFVTYLFSCLYHSLAYNNAKRVFRALTISAVHFLFTACISMFAFNLLEGRKVLLAVGCSLFISLLSLVFNILGFEKFKYVRIVGFVVQTVIALFVTYFSLAFLPHIAFIFMLVSILLFLASFAFHIFGYQLSYLNSVGHIMALAGNAFLFFVILLYVI